MASASVKKLNLGCGARALPSWTNLDFQAVPGLVLAHDLRTPLPFSNDTFDVVYHSHVLEHLSPADAARFLAECHRVLRPGGVLRVLVPDLEDKARLYLEKLAAARAAPSDKTLAEHEWMIVELIDQMVRSRSGGDMLPFLTSGRAAEFAATRIGDEFSRANAAPPPPSAQRPDRIAGLRERLARLLRRLAGVSAKEWDWLRYHRRGESHLWMYDSLSLSRLLGDHRFTDCSVVNAFSSRIPDWATDGRWLDVEADRPRKPDSLCIEAIKPPSPA